MNLCLVDMHRYDLIVLILLAVAVASSEMNSDTRQDACASSLSTSNDIDVVDWKHVASSADGTPAAAIASIGRPALITNAPSTRWPAVVKWRNREYVRRSLSSELKHVYRDRFRREFTYFSSPSLLPRIPSLRLLADAHHADMNVRTGKKIDAYTMYSASPMDCCEKMLSDLVSTEGESPDAFASGDEDPEMTMWFSTTDVVTAIHMDMYQQNFFVQLSGLKRFELWAPSEHESMFLHSSLHRASRQSRVTAVSTPPYATVTLRPGDALYIPPHWFHRVTTIGSGVRIGLDDDHTYSPLSISLSLWTEVSRLRDLVERARGSLVPFEEDWSPATLRARARLFLRDVLDRLGHDANVGEDGFLHRLLASRHGRVNVSCPIGEDDGADGRPSLSVKERRLAEDVAGRFRAISAEIRDIHVMDYAEEIASYVVRRSEDDADDEHVVRRSGDFLCDVICSFQ